MPLTPLDVDNWRLRGALRGYDRGDVDQLRSEVIASIEEYVDLAARLKLRVRELETELTHYREQEDGVKNSLMLAQRTADELVAAARSRAEALLEQARGEAQALRRDVADVVAQREQFEYQFHGLLTGFIRHLEQANPRLGAGSAPAPQHVSAAAAPVHMNMDTQDTTHTDDIQIDMEDLTVQPLAQIVPPQPGAETVVLPMAQPQRGDPDSAQFSAALASAGVRGATERDTPPPAAEQPQVDRAGLPEVEDEL